jgi:CCR4-NOT transcription complex subunit 1
MQLPDPFTPDLKIELLPEVSQHPRISPPMNKLIPEHIRKEIDLCLSRNEDDMDTIVAFLKQQVMQTESMTGSFYNVSLVNALVFYIGLKGIESESMHAQTNSPRPGANSTSIRLWALLLKELDPGESISCFNSIYLFSSLSHILRLT